MKSFTSGAKKYISFSDFKIIKGYDKNIAN